MGTTHRQGCAVREATLERGVRGVILENALIAATVLPDKGADIAALVSKPDGIDVLWKSPWGLLPPGGVHSAADSATAWLEALNFHGEASLAAWDYEIIANSDELAEVRFWTRLRRSPFRIERTMRIAADRPVLHLRERFTNEGRDDLEAMWGHHPAYGAPFLSGACRIDTNARLVRADDELDGPGNELTPRSEFPWPGEAPDLSRVPGENDPPRQTLAYLMDFDGEHGWYGITNTDLGLGVGLVWPAAVFPYAWFWQEMHASPGFPWYRGVYVMAIEPFSSIPGQGLVKVMEKTGTQLSLPAGQSLEAELAAVLYHTKMGITGIEPDGTVQVR
jgi:hypothetical protein